MVSKHERRALSSVSEYGLVCIQVLCIIEQGRNSFHLASIGKQITKTYRLLIGDEFSQMR